MNTFEVVSTCPRNLFKDIHLVCVVPHRYPNTAIDGHALLDDVFVVSLLLGEKGVRAGQCHADVELRNCDF